MNVLKDIIKHDPDKKDTSKSGLHEFEISSENMNEHINEHLSIEQTEMGSLVAINDLPQDELDENIGEEDLKIIIQKKPGEDSIEQDEVTPQTLFVKGDNLAHAFLFGSCKDTLDILVHLLVQATKDVEVIISIGCSTLNIYEIYELVGALNLTKASVKINLLDIQDVVALLLLTTKAKLNLIGPGFTLEPINEAYYATNTNVKAELEVRQLYEGMIYSTLIEQGILLEEEADLLQNKSTITFIDGDIISSRLLKDK